MPIYPTIPCVCRQCGKDFLITVGDANQGRGKYCSHACYWKAKSTPAEPRFWAKVTKGEGCWEWQGAPSANGYGMIKAEGKYIGAHRYSWELYKGAIPDGLFVCHACDNRRCVRPDHLFLGTNQDNQLDALAKGRIKTGVESHGHLQPHPCGEENPNAKLTDAKVREIRERYAAELIEQTLRS